MTIKEVWAVTFRKVPVNDQCPVFATKEIAEEYAAQWEDAEVVPTTVDTDELERNVIEADNDPEYY